MTTKHFEADQFSALVGRIYDCVVEPQKWESVLGELTAVMDGVIATLAVLDVNNCSTRFASAFGEPAIVEPLVTRYAADMPFYHLVPKAPIDVPITMPQLCDMHGPDGLQIFRATRLWTEWFLPNRIVDAMCTNIINAENRIAALVINVSEDRTSITQSDIDKLSLLTPHVRRAVSIGDLFDLNQRGSDAFRATLDELTTGVVIVDDDLDVLYVNRASQNYCKGSTAPVSIKHNRMRFNQPHSHDALLKTVAMGQHDEAALGGRGIGLPLPGDIPCVAHVLPLAHRNTPNLFRGNAAAAIFLCTSDHKSQPNMAGIAALFGLTSAELRVAGQVSGGMNRQAIAKANQVTDGTVKSQLEAIFDKTQTANQRELEKLLRDLSPPIHHE